MVEALGVVGIQLNLLQGGQGQVVEGVERHHGPEVHHLLRKTLVRVLLVKGC